MPPEESVPVCEVASPPAQVRPSSPIHPAENMRLASSASVRAMSEYVGMPLFAIVRGRICYAGAFSHAMAAAPFCSCRRRRLSRLPRAENCYAAHPPAPYLPRVAVSLPEATHQPSFRHRSS